MKKLIYSLFFLLSAGAQAQQDPDSSRVIELRDIVLNNTPAGRQQSLLRYYRSNRQATLEELLARLPEVTMLRRGAYGMEPAIRNLSSGQINVLIDGMRIHGACTDKMDPATIYIEPLNLDRLQVQTGTAGFIQGSAIGGTVNMQLAAPVCHPVSSLSGSFSTGYQSAATGISEALQLRYNKNKWAYLGSITYRKNNDYRAGAGEKVPFSAWEKINYSISALYQHDAANSIKADFIGDHGWNIGYPALPMDVGFASARIAAVTWLHHDPLRRISQWQLKAYANQIRHYMDDTHRPNVAMHMDMPGYSKTAGVYSEAVVRTAGNRQLLLIADAASTWLSASMTMYQTGQLPMYMLTWPDNRKIQAGAGLRWTLLQDSLRSLRLSLRTDLVQYALTTAEAKSYISILGDDSPGRTALLKNLSVSGSQHILTGLQARASFGYAERMPTASELYGFYLYNAQDGYDYVGNTALKPERSLQADIGLTLKSNRVQFSSSYFVQRINDYIYGVVNPSFSAMTIGAHGVKAWQQLDNATLTGVESSLAWKPVPALDIISTISWTSGRDKNGTPLAMIAPFRNSNSVRYQFSRLFIQVDEEWSAAQRRIRTSFGEDATASFLLLHLRTGFQFSLLKKTADLQTGVENILDNRYHAHQDWGNIPRPGRNVYVQLKWNF